MTVTNDLNVLNDIRIAHSDMSCNDNGVLIDSHK